MKKKILIIGGNGQLGNCIKKISKKYELEYDFQFTHRDILDITSEKQVKSCFFSYQPDYCINASAYTNVDLAEKEEKKAFEINTIAVGYLAQECNEFGTDFIHISTDYVFDGFTEIPYSEEDFTNPINIYGKSKLEGEQMALTNHSNTIIIRTSWLYSEFNKNFVKTILSLANEKKELNIVSDQFGQPTNANDLAEAIMQIIENKNKKYDVFHFSNYSETNWKEFAQKITEFSGSETKINPISSLEYSTLAKRPRRSTLCLDKIENTYGIELKHWENSLKDFIENLR